MLPALLGTVGVSDALYIIGTVINRSVGVGTIIL